MKGMYEPKEDFEREGTTEVKEPGETLLGALTLTCRIMVYPLASLPTVGLYVGLIWLCMLIRARGDYTSALFNADTDNLERLILPNSTIVGRGQELALNGLANVCAMLIFPTMTLPYFGFRWPLKCLGFSFSVIALAYLIGWIIYNIRPMYEATPVLFILLYSLSVMVSFPEKRVVGWTIMAQLSVMACAIVFLPFARAVSLKNEAGTNILRLLVIYPIIREILRFLGSLGGWTLANLSYSPHAYYPAFFVGYIQTVFALFFRYQVTNLSDTFSRSIVTLIQGVLEVALRVTVTSRDKLTRKLVSSSNSRMGRSARKIGDLAFARAKPKQITDESLYTAYYSAVVLMEMEGEYIAILAAPFLALVFSTVPLYAPFEMYNTPDLGRSLDVQDMIWSMLIQFAVEIIVDVSCIMWETRNANLNFRTCIESRPKFAFIILQVAVFYITMSSVEMGKGDSFASCMGFAMCCCLGNGILSGGVHETYCFLSYNTSNVSIIKQLAECPS